MKVSRRNWLCHAYCLMSNHYHLLLETPDGNLSAGMKLLNSAYAQFGFDKFAAEQEYVLFVNDSDDTVSPFEKTRGHLILGGEQFVESFA